jgi:hypothetical protein
MSWTTAQKQDLKFFPIALGISKASTFERNKSFFVKIEYSNPIIGDTKVLVTKGGTGVAKLNEFMLDIVNPNRCDHLQLNLQEFQKASTLKCDLVVTAGGLEDDGDVIPPMPPASVDCQINREEACNGFEIMLAAGIKNPESRSREVAGSANMKGPAFATKGQTNGFSGYVSNRFTVPPNSELCR